jgi:hypothetical protein
MRRGRAPEPPGAPPAHVALAEERWQKIRGSHLWIETQRTQKGFARASDFPTAERAAAARGTRAAARPLPARGAGACAA